MVSIIKNQLLKHLSRFTKNLAADQINLSTLRGEGELSNLELDENVLTDLLELPSWLRLTSAWCNKVIIRIQWTKLKSVPIFLHLDEVQVEVVTCEDLRSPSSPSNATAFPGGATKYSFIHKVIDGITVAVNTVSVTLKSPAFIASVQMSRIMVESKSPTWQRCDLRMTRVKDTDRGQLLIFKELEWQTVRIEAQSTKDKDLTPLRLLTNQARCRITIKKRISDCFVMGSRLVLILDDLLWVLTDSQLKAALHFVDSLGSLIERATTVERKMKAARKLEVLPEYQAQISQQARSKVVCNTAISKIFMRYDVVETSYHFLSQRIDLHLCDDPGSGRSSHPELKDGGALQISLVKFQIDYYPYHLAMADRKHWAKYRENSTPHAQWLQQSLNSFRGQFLEFIDHAQSHSTSRKYSTDQTNESNAANEKWNNEQHTPLLHRQESKKSGAQPLRNFVLEQFSKLMTTCIIIRIHDFTIYKVTTSSQKPTTKEFVTGDREKFALPDDVTILHAEFTYYYYPGDLTFPLPPPKFYVQLNPLQLNYDMYSCLWFNSFVLNLYQSLMLAGNKEKQEAPSSVYFDVKLEAILPRIVLEAQNDYPNQRDRPKSLNIQTSRITLTNVRTTERSSRADLAECLNAFQMGQMFFSTGFPSKTDDFHIVTEKFLRHCAGTDNVRMHAEEFHINSIDDLKGESSKKLLWLEAKDVWCCTFEPVWADFFGARSVGSARPIAFIDAFPVTIWIHMNENRETAVEQKMADIHCLAYVGNLISIQLNHYQYLFLLRQLEILSEMSTYLVVDSKQVLNSPTESSLVIGVMVPQVEVTLVMPSQTPGKENSGGDLESVVPDSSSIVEELANQNILASSARLEFSTKRFNTSNDVETPQSEAASMISSSDVLHPMVTFKQIDKNEMKESNQQLSGNRPHSADLDLRKSLRFSKESPATPSVSNNFNVGLSSMKKGFANLMTSIDSALKASPEDGSSDTVSMRSDVSSDSENYIVVTLEDQEKADALFGGLNCTGITTVEEASEVIEETPDTQSEKSLDSTSKRKDLVSMVTFKLSKVELIQQSRGFGSAIKLQIGCVTSEECSSIPWDEFQGKFSSRSRGWVELQSNDCKSAIKARFEHDLSEKAADTSITNMNFNRMGLMTLFDDHLIAEVEDLSLTLSMSVITGLTDLIEDEIIAVPLKMTIFVKNINLKLNEDRPPNNITSPGPQPIDVAVGKLNITRDKNGIFHIEGIQSDLETPGHKFEGKKVIVEMKELNKKLVEDNEELKRRVMALDRFSDENLRLRHGQKELIEVKSRLNDAEALIKQLIQEKSMLEETVIELQRQSTKSGGDSSPCRPTWSIKR